MPLWASMASGATPDRSAAAATSATPAAQVPMSPPIPRIQASSLRATSSGAGVSASAKSASASRQ